MPACLPALQDTKRGNLGCVVFVEVPAKAISQHQLGALPQNYMLIQLTDASPEKQQQQEAVAAQQGSCTAAGAGAEQAGGDPVTVAAQLPDGSWRRFEGMLGEFGPVFEPGCGGVDDDGSSGGSSSSSSSRDSSSGNAGAASKQQQAAAAAGSAPPPLQWQGRQLVLRQGGPREGPYRLLYLADSNGDGGVAEAEDPYLDPEDEEEEEEEEEEEDEIERGSSRGGGAGTASRAAAAADGGGSDGNDGEGEEGDGDEAYADGLDEEPEHVSSGGGGSVVEDDIYPTIYPVLCSAEAPAVAAQPLDACSTLHNAAELNGSIAIVQRGRWAGGQAGGVSVAAPGHQSLLPSQPQTHSALHRQDGHTNCPTCSPPCPCLPPLQLHVC